MSANLGNVKQLTMPLLSDPERSVLKAYGVDDPETEIAWPSVFIVSGPADAPKIAWRWTADVYRDRISTDEVLAQVKR